MACPIKSVEKSLRRFSKSQILPTGLQNPQESLEEVLQKHHIEII
jgi:hypothetical protein